MRVASGTERLQLTPVVRVRAVSTICRRVAALPPVLRTTLALIQAALRAPGRRASRTPQVALEWAVSSQLRATAAILDSAAGLAWAGPQAGLAVLAEEAMAAWAAAPAKVAAQAARAARAARAATS